MNLVALADGGWMSTKVTCWRIEKHDGYMWEGSEEVSFVGSG